MLFTTQAQLFKYLKSVLGKKRVKSYISANERTDEHADEKKTNKTNKNDRQVDKYRVKHLMMRTWIASLILTLSKIWIYWQYFGK